MATAESRKLINHDESLSSNSDDLEMDENSAASIMASVREQEEQFAQLTKEIENERKTVAKQLNHDRRNDVEYTGNMAANSYFHSPQPEFVTETVSRREDYGDPSEETEVIIDENGVSKTVTKRTVTKTVTERRIRQVDEHGSLPRDSRNGVRHGSDQYDSMDRNNPYDDESKGLLRRRSSSSSSSSDGDRQPVGYSYTPSNSSRKNMPRPAQPEKFQPEDYGLEDDRRSEYSDEDDQYGLEPADVSYQNRRSTSSPSVESDSNRYDEQLDELPVTLPRNDSRVETTRAPLAMQETGSRASLDKLGGSWKTPTLKEVIEMLSYNMPVVQQNAAAYLQHLSYNDDQVKADVRKLGGIPPLIKLLDNGNPQVEQNSCGALRNLCYGPRNDKNKIEMKSHEGVPAVVRLIRSTKDIDTKEQATGTLWNLSAHPELKGQVLELGLEPLANLIIIPYSESISKQGAKVKEVVMVDVFTNAVGVIRNLSSSDSQDSRRKLRQCEGLLFALISALQANKENDNIDNKATENCLCVLRNLTYKLQDETPNSKDLYTLERPKGKDTKDKSDIGCLGKKKPKEVAVDSVDQIPLDDPDATGAELLWQPENTRLYISLLQECNTDEIIEASLGALQNLTSGVWQWAVYARAVVRKEKGLPVVIDRLRTDNDRIVRAGAITLSNLSEDPKNKELVGKFAMKDLVYKLPGGTDPNIRLSDITTIAILNTIRVLVDRSPDNVRFLRDSGGVERITTINNARDATRFHARVVKAAGQALKAIWANKSSQSILKKDGWNKNHFVPTVTADTLPRNSGAGSRPYEEARSVPSSSGGRRAERSASQADQSELAPLNPSSDEPVRKEKSADSWV